MIKNVTLLLLHITSLSSTSALFSPAAFTQHSFYNFQSLYMTKHYSTFLQFSANHASSIISNSKFTYFLNSVISIHQDDNLPQYEGISDQSNNPISPRVSFVCNCTSFFRNTSPYNGAAILVHSNINSINSINALIENTNFNENSALMGGAIYYESSTINLTDCHFKSNAAQVGSHIFFSCTTSNVDKCSFQEGAGASSCDSSLELTSSESASQNYFRNCQFFLNKGPFRVNGANVNADLTSCCLLYYAEGDYFTYDNSNIVILTNGGKISLTNVALNEKFVSSGTYSSINVGSLPKAPSTDILNSCRLIPVPTETSHYKINSEPAIFALVAIIFFVLVSIIGIFIVTCKKKKDLPPEDAVNEPLKAKN